MLVANVMFCINNGIKNFSVWGLKKILFFICEMHATIFFLFQSENFDPVVTTSIKPTYEVEDNRWSYHKNFPLQNCGQHQRNDVNSR